MFPKATATSAPTAGQPGNPDVTPAAHVTTPQDGAPTTGQTPKFVTQEELQAAVAAAAAEAERRAQSLLSKQENRIKTAMEALRKQGVQTPTREMATALLEATDPKPEQTTQPAAPAATAPQTTPAQVTPVAQHPPQLSPEQSTATQWMAEDGAPMNAFTAQGYLMMVKAGVRLGEGDPELASIKTDGEGYEFLTTLAAAIEAKKARTVRAEGTSRAPGGLPQASGAPGGQVDALALFAKAYNSPK